MTSCLQLLGCFLLCNLLLHSCSLHLRLLLLSSCVYSEGSFLECFALSEIRIWLWQWLGKLGWLRPKTNLCEGINLLRRRVHAGWHWSWINHLAIIVRSGDLSRRIHRLSWQRAAYCGWERLDRHHTWWVAHRWILRRCCLSK